MHELYPNIVTEGKILLNEEDVYGMSTIKLRRKIGMVFQRPNPFPTMSIFDNVIAGYKLNGIRLKKSEKEEIVETSLRDVALWSEVKESLFKKLQDHGYRPTFSNAYIIDDMEALSRQRFLSVTSLMAMTTEKSVRGLKQLAKGEAVFHDITNISLVDGSVPSPQQEALLGRFGNIVDHALLKEVPLVDPEKAAKNLYNIARNYHVTLFEYFLTDRAGHDGDMDKALEVLQRLEVFTETLLGLMNMNRQTFILTSDHGNVEDLSVPTHTYNPVPFTVAGRGERYLKGISSLYEITPSIMENVHYLL
jgi:hypothetical protein